MSRTFRAISVLLLAVLFAGPAVAGPSSALERRIYASFVDGDYARAAALIEQYLKASPRDAVMLYNGACAYSRLGRNERAASYLRRSIDAGLRDLDQILADPDLKGLRDHPTYQAVIAHLRRPALRHIHEALDRWRAIFGDEQYRYEADERRRIAFATALDPMSHREMREMVERQADQLLASLFESAAAGYVLVAVPTPRDADRLLEGEHIGGMYEHAKRQLVARDIGGSLRHEFVHALHHQHMEQLGQQHPLWIQEGLATLYEDYAFNEDGSIVFLPNERHNIVKRRGRAHLLTSWDDLLVISEEAFMARAQQLYPQVRSMFEFVADRGHLSCWYRALVEHFDEDRTGKKAFERCCGGPAEEGERQWRRWLAQRPYVDLSIDEGDAALGIVSRPNAINDGVVIVEFLPYSAAKRGQLRLGDVIVSVDGEPTRSLPELQAVIASKKVGDLVGVRARRNGSYFTVVVSLRPLQPIMW